MSICPLRAPVPWLRQTRYREMCAYCIRWRDACIYVCMYRIWCMNVCAMGVYRVCCMLLGFLRSSKQVSALCVFTYRIWCMCRYTCVSHLMYIYIVSDTCMHRIVSDVWFVCHSCMFVCIVSDVCIYVCMYVLHLIASVLYIIFHAFLQHSLYIH